MPTITKIPNRNLKAKITQITKVPFFLSSSFSFPHFSQQTNQGFRVSQISQKSHHEIQSQTPRTIRPVPSKACPTRVFSPNSNPKTAVAANVVALVTGTAREMGVWLRMAKKVAEAERFIKKGTEYCQIERRVSQFLSEAMSLLWGGACGGLEVDLRASSQSSAPRRMMALVAPQTRPTATIFSTSPIMARSAIFALVKTRSHFCEVALAVNSLLFCSYNLIEICTNKYF